MPPKKVAQSKAEAKAKQKVVEDKTFGLKNKNKSKTVQKYIKSVQAQVTGGRVKSEHELKAEQKEKTDEKRKAKQQAALLASLQKAQDLLKGAAKTDNKAIGDAQKLDIYVDPRTLKEEDEMGQWDQEKLEQVVKTKHGGQKCQSDIVCKYFLDALEKRQYGWFWQCPNGEQCHYKHALPPGYELRRKDPLESLNQLDAGEPLEEILERERQALPAGGTPVTFETFSAWKLKKENEEKEIKAAAQKKREKETGRLEMSGRALFIFNKDLFKDGEASSEDDGEEDEFVKLLAAKKVADDEEDKRVQAQAEANLLAANAAAAAVVSPRSPQETGEAETVTDIKVHNKALFALQLDAPINPDDLDD